MSTVELANIIWGCVELFFVTFLFLELPVVVANGLVEVVDLFLQ